MLNFAATPRTIESKRWRSGSIPPAMRPVYDRLRDVGVKVELQERGEYTPTEHAVDDALRLKMMHTLFDDSWRVNPRIATAFG